MERVSQCVPSTAWRMADDQESGDSFIEDFGAADGISNVSTEQNNAS